MTERLQDKIAIITGAGCVGPGWGNGRATCGALRRGRRQDLRGRPQSRDASPRPSTRVKAVGGEIVDAAMRRHRQRVGRRHGRGLPRPLRPHRRAGEQCRRLGAGRPGGADARRSGTRSSTINLTSVFLACKHVLPVMERQGGGAIVNIASTSGIRFTGASQVGYAATKAGVIQFSRVVAVQYAPQGHPREHGGAGPAAHADGRGAARAQRAGGDVEALLAQRRRPHPDRLHAATAATPPMPRCSSPPTKRASSPAPRSWSTAACRCAATSLRNNFQTGAR